MTEFLNHPVYFLGRSHPGVLDPALLRTEEKRVALFFTSEHGANAHLADLSETVTVQCAAEDRAKEELFEAALVRGAAELWLDTPPDGKPALKYPLARARDYVRSFKRQSACL